jgi:acetyl esterase/lipase
LAATLDPALFLPGAIDASTQAFNAELLAKLEALPDPWLFAPSVIRARRRAGLGPFPPEPMAPDAEMIEIAGQHGPVTLRVLRPRQPEPVGVFLHIHGGGWVLGACDFQDQRLLALAEATGLVAVSVEYRLAPEHPYPQGPDDCETAALWIVAEAAARLGVGPMRAIGGESAGAHLSVTTLARLRDRHGLRPFHAAILTAGCYDLGLTPSARRWGSERLVLNTRDIEMFARHFLLHGGSLDDPDISPLYGDLRGLPPALFSVGTRDALVDDTLMMAGRWAAAGNAIALEVFPGGCHVFQSFDFPLAHHGNAVIAAYLKRITDDVMQP